MGVIDETGSLKYGEVYIQISEDMDNPGKVKRVIEGKVVVGKNPCFTRHKIVGNFLENFRILLVILGTLRATLGKFFIIS